MSMGFPRQESWSVFGKLLHLLVNWSPFTGDLPDPGMESWSPAMQVDSLPSELAGKPITNKERCELHFLEGWLVCCAREKVSQADDVEY